MENKTKAVFAGLLTLLGLGWLASRAKALPEGLAAGISVAIYDTDGNLVPHNSPALLVPGTSYYAEATVTNKSTYRDTGNPAPQTFGIGVILSIGGYYRVNYSTSYAFTANEVKAFQSPAFAITEADYEAQFGVENLVVASVFAENFLVQAKETIEIAQPPIVSSALVTVGVGVF